MSESIIGAIQLLLKSLTLIGLGVYLVFALIIVRQEALMTNVLEEHSEPIIRILSYIHLFAAVFILMMAIFVLP